MVLLPLPGVRARERVEVRLSDLRGGTSLDPSIRTVVVRFLPPVCARGPPETGVRAGRHRDGRGSHETALLRDRTPGDPGHASTSKPRKRNQLRRTWCE